VPHFVISVLFLIIILNIHYFINSLFLTVILKSSFVINRHFKNLFCLHILFF